MFAKFNEWLSQRLSQEQPHGAGDLDDNQSNSDRAFGKSGVVSKNTTKSISADISKFNPEKMYGKKGSKK